jgi:ATP-dependent DNA helicase DinG
MKNACMAVPSPFPVEHRLIYSWPIIHWPRFDRDQTTIAPDLAQAVNHILTLHPNERGLIHSVSYSRTKLLLDYCKSPRLFTHTKEESFDDAVVRLANTERAVLVSPRATEGVDLKGSLSEFQIFIKIPFQFLGDPLVKGRQSANKGWYDLMAVMTIVQGAGRSVRTSTDIAPTYILDARWPSWFRANKYLFPEYFQNAVRPFDTATVTV